MGAVVVNPGWNNPYGKIRVRETKLIVVDKVLAEAKGETKVSKECCNGKDEASG